MSKPVSPLLALFLALGLASCDQPPSPAAALSPAPDAMATTAAAQCPDVAFEAFLERFAASTQAQQAATADPLELRRVDGQAQPEPALVTQSLAPSQLDWPLMPSLQASHDSGRSVAIEGSGGERVVTLRTPDSGDQQRYHFRQQPCWTLVRLEDDAI